MRKSRFILFLAGLLCGALIFSAAPGLTKGYNKANTVQTAITHVRYVISGEEVQPGAQPGYYWNGRSYVPAALNYAGTTYVPLRFVGEALGLTVDWDETARTITIHKSAAPSPGTETIPFSSVTLEDAPPAVRELLERSRRLELAQTLASGDKTYLIVTRGEMKAGGYGVRIEKVTENEEEIEVTISYTDPKPGSFVTQVLTYPSLVAAIPRTDKPVHFTRSDANYIPRLRGVPNLETSRAESTNIRLFQHYVTEEGLVIRGVARVFESTVSWRVTDTNGHPVQEGYTQAAAGGPDWGYFSFVLPASYASEKDLTLQVFWSSPKDGTPLDVVSVDLSSLRRG